MKERVNFIWIWVWVLKPEPYPKITDPDSSFSKCGGDQAYPDPPTLVTTRVVKPPVQLWDIHSLTYTVRIFRDTTCCPSRFFTTLLWFRIRCAGATG